MINVKLRRRGLTIEERRALAQSLDSGPNVLRRLARDRDARVRSSTAANPHVRSETLRRLAKDREVTVRWRVASNPSTPINLLRRLLRDAAGEVRAWAASNENLNAGELDSLAVNPDTFIRIGLAWNPNTPNITLAFLMLEAPLAVREAVLRREWVTFSSQRSRGHLRRVPRLIYGDVETQRRHEVVERYLSLISIDSLEKLAVASSTEAEYRKFVDVFGDENWTVRYELNFRAVQHDLDPEVAAVILRTAKQADGVATAGPMSETVVHLAENPSTPARVLASILDEMVGPITLAWLTRDFLGNWGNPNSEEDRLAIALATNPNTAPDSLRILACHREMIVRLIVAKRTQGPELEHLARDSNENVRMGAAMNPHLSPANLTRLSFDQSVGVRVRVVGNPKTPVDTLRELVRQSKVVLERVISERSTEPSRIADRDGEIISILSNACYNPGMPEEVLDELARLLSGQLSIKAIASNPSTPPVALATLGTSGIARNELAENHRTPTETLRLIGEWALGETLPSDSYEEDELIALLIAIASNPSSPPGTVRKAARKITQVDRGYGRVDLDRVVAPVSFFVAMVDAVFGPLHTDRPKNLSLAEALASNARTPSEHLRLLSKGNIPRVRAGVASNIATPHSTVLLLARDPEADVRSAAARNPTLPVMTLHELASDNDSRVRKSVAGNPNASAESLAQLTTDAVFAVREAAEQNPNAHSGDRLCGRLAAAMDNRTDPEALSVLALDPEPAVRQAAAVNRHTPQDTIDALAKDESAGVRRAVASNGIASDRALATLSADPTLLVPNRVETS